ncbi:murein hydrolase activator EnvC family protein [Sulfuriferula thiophila]|uniref:murein hydrolase activator EnvC family protein n=1 Tax=Sulfuriferula thiophila TaxID=1781211 RepID=UPI000F60B7A8|nr:peptidoglycan DD-metalloendopeptidase family protein [Sulfuriferula thiophila]
MNPRSFIAAIAFASQLFSANAIAAQNESELAAIRSKIEQLRQQNHAAETNRDRAADALQKSERAISDANRALFELDQQRNETELALSELHSQSQTAHKAIERQQNELMALIRQQYFSGQSDTAKLLMNGENPNQITRNLTYFSYISKARNQLISELQHNLNQLDQLAVSQQQQQTRLDQIRQQHQQQKQTLQAQRQIKQQVVKQLGSEIQQQRQQIATLEQDEKRITKLMQDIARAIAKRKAKEEAAAALRAKKEASTRATAKPVKPTNTTRPPAQPVTPDSGLGKLKGHLILPTRGELIHRFGTPREQGGTLWKGLFIKAPAGQPVHSIAGGEVVFADWLRGFGNLIIIDHGGGYMSLYSNNETLYKQVGSSVKAGDTIASVGNTGGNNETGLYFELRYQSQAFDPSNWIAR